MRCDDGVVGGREFGKEIFVGFDEVDGVVDGEVGGVYDVFVEVVGEIGDEGDGGVFIGVLVFDEVCGEVLGEEGVVGVLGDDFVEEDFVGGVVGVFEGFGVVLDDGVSEVGMGEGI